LLPHLAIAVLLLGACPHAARLPELRVADLGLPAPPTTAAHLEISGGDRSYSGPARLEVVSAQPLYLRLEDLALAEPLEILVDQRSPVHFGQPLGPQFTDTGTFLETDGRLLFSLTRTWDAASERAGEQDRIVVVGRLAPKTQKPPRDWLAPGTTLFYGLTWDDKPITKLVPLGLMVTLEAAPDGGRVLAWQADVDPDAEVEDTTQRTRRGRREIPPEVAEAAASYADDFEGGGDVSDHASLFVPRQARRTLSSMGVAAWHDSQAPSSGLLQAQGSLSLTIQADDALWSIPATVARVQDSGATYLIADDPHDPLLLYASRPGWSMRLMAIGRPAPE